MAAARWNTTPLLSDRPKKRITSYNGTFIRPGSEITFDLATIFPTPGTRSKS